ncbi:hypothetical protein KCM76_04485 [Zooshikella marina]|uniref:Outer membrane protein assembly factor BamE n=1 Tax=Zooshikella ganghwensis TaxID=202772 RepID=A0A4P9VQJ0_9GAMM|nr:hypothetical protein [Zooshikella ganghwensis]MBU2705223.1 hypothetical protein [Zooshikella ganghwensis]RDH44352.1 hypothetical protein B9G39_13365 [Zooshikella ganghwensis]
MKSLVISSLTLFLSLSCWGETVNIADQKQQSQVGDLPHHGLTEQQVRHQFGEPKATHSVGQPTITRWEYDKFTVYFDRQQVLHSVVHRNP